MADGLARGPPAGAGDGAAGDEPYRARLAELAAELARARDVDDVMSVLVLEAERAFGAASAVAYARRGDALEFVAAMGRAEDSGEWLRRIPVDAHIPVARATREATPGWYESRAALVAAFPGWAARVPHVERFGALVALPLRLGEVTLGAIGFAFDAERSFSPEEREALLVLAAAGAVALARVRGREEELGFSDGPA